MISLGITSPNKTFKKEVKTKQTLLNIKCWIPSGSQGSLSQLGLWGYQPVEQQPVSNEGRAM